MNNKVAEQCSCPAECFGIGEPNKDGTLVRRRLCHIQLLRHRRVFENAWGRRPRVGSGAEAKVDFKLQWESLRERSGSNYFQLPEAAGCNVNVVCRLVTST